MGNMFKEKSIWKEQINMYAMNFTCFMSPLPVKEQAVGQQHNGLIIHLYSS